MSPVIHVELTFLRTEDGGRNRPASAGYMPLLAIGGLLVGTRCEFVSAEHANPGDQVTARLSLVFPDVFNALRARLGPGAEFELREGSRVVARGRVIRIEE
jgi:translation elongation factor EF-Tu-like GTPase